MKYDWYRNELKDKYRLLSRLKDNEINKEMLDKIINTKSVIDILLSKERIPGSFDIMVYNDYIDLSKTMFMWEYITKLALINNDYIPNFSFDDTKLKNKEIFDLVEDFFKNGTNRKIYDLFIQIWKKNNKNIHIISNYPEAYYSGETFYLEYFDNTYIQTLKKNSFEDVSTLCHEFGHAMQFNINYNKNLYLNLNIFVEIISIFFELISLDYFMNTEYKRSSIIVSYSILDEYLENSKSLNNYLNIIKLVDIKNFDSSIENIENRLSKKDKDNYYNLRCSRDYIYETSFLIASNLFMIYKIDRDKAFYLIDRIINIDSNIDVYSYYKILLSLDLLNTSRTKEFDTLIKRRAKSI